MTTENTRIVLRTSGDNDPIVDHPGQPAAPAFNAQLESSIEQIYQASVHKQPTSP
jgi:hypothetical protein